MTDRPRKVSRFQPVGDATEAHPIRDEYVTERSLGDGRWVVDSISPHATAEEAEVADAWVIPCAPEATFRIVRRTITSTVVAVRPGVEPEGQQL